MYVYRIRSYAQLGQAYMYVCTLYCSLSGRLYGCVRVLGALSVHRRIVMGVVVNLQVGRNGGIEFGGASS